MHTNLLDLIIELMHTNSYEASAKSLAVLSNGYLLIGFSNGKIRVKDKNKLESDGVKTVINGHLKSVNSFAAFSNGDFASASDDAQIII